MPITEPANRIEAELHPWSLRFRHTPLEEEFRSFNDNDARVFGRVGIILSYVAWFATAVFLYFSFHQYYLSVVKMLVFFLYPTFALTMITLSSERYLKYFQLSTAVSVGAAGMSIVYYGHLILQSDLLALFGVTVVVLFAFFIMRLRFTVAIWTTLLFVTFYQVLLLTTPSTHEIGLISFILWVVESTCAVGGNLLERANRKTFYQNKLRQNAEEKVVHLAYHDALTGLPNRLLFMERLKQFLDSRRPFALLYIDLDQFKTINDTRGHTIGDQLLKTIAQNLIHCVREHDMVSRIGGDEFTVILPTDTKAEVAGIAEKTVAELRKPIFIGDSEFYLRASIGISSYPKDGEDIETLIKHADIAMYASKELVGNHYVFFSSSMKQSLEERLNLQGRLYDALANDEFVMYYQPQVDLRTGRLFGVEALIRWMHPQKGLIPPDQFIPIAEETGLIIPIGDWALRTACMQAKEWNRDSRHPIHLSVNLSVKQFAANDIVARVERIIRETGFDANLLELELTENVFLQHTQSVATTMKKIQRARGADIGKRQTVPTFPSVFADGIVIPTVGS